MIMKELYAQLGISSAVYDFGKTVEDSLKERFEKFDKTAEYNQMKVIHAMQKNRVSEACFGASSGYGYNDLGRETLEQVYADTFHTEACLVRPQITCGTHALAIALFGNLRPGDELLSPVGKPYDTLEEVIGIRPSNGSLTEYGVKYRQVDLLEDGTFDYENIKKAVNEKTKLVTIQRSKGYQTRPSFSVKQIGELIAFVKKIKPEVICMVDNCYGEFTCKEEPIELGADITAGSLIKNAGGGFAPTGAYICGKADLVELCAHAWTAPGLGSEMGSYAASYRPFFEGLFMAPHVTRQAMMSAEFCSSVFKILGFSVTPEPGHLRTDLITAITLDTEENMCRFAEAVQSWSPVDSDATPIPGPMPGYVDPIIMAAGTFVQGSTIEMSADGPVRPPYIMYFQGGLVFEHALLAVMGAAERIIESQNEL